MRSSIRALLVAVVAMLGMILVAPGIAEAKSKTVRTVKSTHTTRTTKSTKSTKRVVKHPWSKGHAKAQPRPHRVRTSPAAKRHPAKG